MKLAKGNWIRPLIWLVLVTATVVCIVRVQNAERDEMERLHPWLREMRLREKEHETFHAAERVKLAKYLREGNLPQTNVWQSYTTMARNMTIGEKADFAKKFEGKFRPAVQKWFAAYENRIPFKLEDVSPDKFHSAFRNQMFTFMFSDITLRFVISRDTNAPAMVVYMKVRQADIDTNQTPVTDFVPDLSVPVTGDEIIRMVKADIGFEFKPNEVRITSTANSSTINGGAFIELLPSNDTPNNIPRKISMTFRSDGKLVKYETVASSEN